MPTRAQPGAGGPEPLRRRLKRGVLNAPVPGRERLLRGGWSAWERYLSWRTRERGSEVARNGGLPLPPPRLRVLVSGSGSSEIFLESGAAQARMLRELVARNGAELAELGAVLDLGCGCGRIARHWAGTRGPRFHGCDINPELARWCAENLPFLEARVNGLEPPLPFGGERFDLIYAISVFTHLPEELQQAWLEEIRASLRPGGLFLLTVSGDHYRSRLDRTDLAAYDAGELVIHFEETAGSNLCATWHPRAYVERRMTAGFELLEHYRDGALHFGQDVYVLRRLTENG